MPIIQRYILRQLVAVTVLVTLTLTLAIWLAQSLRFVELIINRGLSLHGYFSLTILLLPSFLSILLPVAVFTATLFTYNKLMTDSELVVLRAAGFSPGALARPALLLGAAATIFGYMLTLWLLPLSYRQFKDIEFDARNDYTAVLLKEGTFNNVSEGITVYLRARDLDGELMGILIHDSRVRGKTVTVMAERGRLAITEEGPRIVLVNGNRQQIDPDTGKLSLLYFERYSVDLGRVGQRAQDRWREPRERYLGELIRVSDDPDDRAYRNRLLAEAHSRLTSPLLPLAFVLVSLAALLSGDFKRRGQSRRVLAAVAITAVLQTTAIALGNVIAKWPPLAPLAYAHVFLTIVVALWWLLRRPAMPSRSWAPAPG